MYKHFEKTKVISRNLVVDWVQGIRNVLGLRLKGYEDRIQSTIKELIVEAESEGEISWHRMSVNQISKEAIMITVYGCYK